MAKRTIRLETESENHEQTKLSQPVARRRFSRWKLFGILLLILISTAVFLPQIASHTSLGDWALRSLLPADYGRLTVGNRNLAWWSPVSAGEIRLLGKDGALLAEVGTLRTRETLWEILSTGKLTRLEVDQAAGRLEWRLDGSNWEDYVYPLMDAMGSSNGEMVDLEIVFNNSQALLESQTDDQRWMAMDVAGKVLVLQNGNDIRIQTVGKLMDARQNLAAGDFETTLVVGTQDVLKQVVDEMQIQCAGAGFNQGTLQGGVAFTAKVENGAASVGRSIARRYLPSLELNGLATGKVAGVCNYLGDYVFVQTPKVTTEQFAYGDQDYLSGDIVRQRRMDVTGAFEMNPGGFVFHDTRVSADFGRFDLSGVANYSDLYAIWEKRRLPPVELTTSGNINLAQLANQLRHTLQLREGLQLDGGDLRWQVFNRKESDGSTRLLIDAVAKNLSGQLGTERIVWEQPIKIVTSLRDQQKPVFVEKLDVASNFLTATARPELAGGVVEFQCDFDEMKQALDQFFQLPPMTMKGRGAGNVRWAFHAPTAQSAPHLDAQLVLNLQNANLILPGVFELRDPDIAVQGRTRLELGSQQQPSGTLFEALMQSPDLLIRSGRIDLQTGQAAVALRQNPTGAPAQPLTENPIDFPLGLTATLTQPIQVSRLLKALNRLSGVGAGAPTTQQPVLVADLQLNGPLESWISMVRPILAGTDIALTGGSRSQARLTMMDSFATIGNINARAQQFGFRGYGTIVQEPNVQIEGALSYHFDPGLIHIGDLTINSSTAVVRATQTKFRLVNGRPNLSGDVGYRINLYRLHQTLSLMQVAAEDDGVQLGMQQRSQAIQQLAGGRTLPEFQSIALVNFNAPVAPVPPAATAPLGDLKVGGEWAGTAKFEQNESGETTIHLDSTLNEAWVGAIQPNGQLAAYVKEPVIVIKGDGTLAPDVNQLAITKLTVQSHRMAAGIVGNFTQLTTQPIINTQIGANADLLQWIRPFAGDALGDLQIDGLKQHELQLTGPLDITGLNGTWKTNWNSIGWMGLTGGPAKLNLNLKQGILKMDPLRFEAGGGRVNLAPEVDLRDETVWVRLPRGMVFQDVQLTPKLCRNWLKYAAPLLAEVTSVQGTFSLDSDGIEVPISNWTAMVAKARVTINGARVGPGPLGIQIGQVISAVKTVSDGGALDASTLGDLGLGGLSGLANSGNGQRTEALEQLASGVLGTLGGGQANDLSQLVAGNPPASGNSAPLGTQDREKIWLDIPQQTVALNYVKGGVEHDRLRMTIKGFELESSGRVGLDQSLAVNNTLKIPQEILDKNPVVANSFGPSLNMPITGTLTKPSLQSSQLRTALNTAINRGVQRAVGEQLEKKLGVPGLGELKNGSGNPLDGLIQQGQQRFGNPLNKKLGLPEGSNPLQGLLPNVVPPSQTTKPQATAPQTISPAGQPATSPNPLDRLLNDKLDQGFQKLFPNKN